MEPLLRGQFRMASVSLQLAWHRHGLTMARLEQVAAKLAGTYPVLSKLVPPQVAVETLQLASDDRCYLVELAPHRAGWRWLSRSPSEPAMPLGTMAETGVAVLADLASQLDVRVGRVGLVVERLAAHASPALALGYQVLSPMVSAAMVQPAGLALELRERVGIAGRAATTVLRVASVMRRPGAGDSAALLAHEVSTLEEDQGAAQLSRAQLGAFAMAAAAHAEQQLVALFPHAN